MQIRIPFLCECGLAVRVAWMFCRTVAVPGKRRDLPINT